MADNLEVDFHSNPRFLVEPNQQLAAGTLVCGESPCHHAFGMGVMLDGPVSQFGHVNITAFRDSWLMRGPEEYPAVGRAVKAVILGYTPSGQLRLSTRPTDLRPTDFADRHAPLPPADPGDRQANPGSTNDRM